MLLLAVYFFHASSNSKLLDKRSSQQKQFFFVILGCVFDGFDFLGGMRSVVCFICESRDAPGMRQHGTALRTYALVRFDGVFFQGGCAACFSYHMI